MQQTAAGTSTADKDCHLDYHLLSFSSDCANSVATDDRISTRHLAYQTLSRAYSTRRAAATVTRRQRWPRPSDASPVSRARDYASGGRARVMHRQYRERRSA
eukprot:6176240-Pleurochrysis_carterae.AAC.1